MQTGRASKTINHVGEHIRRHLRRDAQIGCAGIPGTNYRDSRNRPLFQKISQTQFRRISLALRVSHILGICSDWILRRIDGQNATYMQGVGLIFTLIYQRFPDLPLTKNVDANSEAEDIQRIQSRG
ncbi:hypothetical protein D3C86_1889860 [compost metagenome]